MYNLEQTSLEVEGGDPNYKRELERGLDGLEMTIGDNQMLLESLAKHAGSNMEIPDFISETAEVINACNDEIYELEQES